MWARCGPGTGCSSTGRRRRRHVRRPDRGGAGRGGHRGVQHAQRRAGALDRCRARGRLHHGGLHRRARALRRDPGQRGNRPASRLRRALTPAGTLVLNGGGSPGHVFGHRAGILRAVVVNGLVRERLRLIPHDEAGATAHPHRAHRGREAHTGPRPDVPAGRHGRGPAPRGAGARTRQDRHHRGVRPARAPGTPGNQRTSSYNVLRPPPATAARSGRRRPPRWTARRPPGISWPRPSTGRSPRAREPRTAELRPGRCPRTPGPPSGSREKPRESWSPARPDTSPGGNHTGCCSTRTRKNRQEPPVQVSRRLALPTSQPGRPHNPPVVGLDAEPNGKSGRHGRPGT